MLLTLLIVYCCLGDYTVFDIHDPEDDAAPEADAVVTPAQPMVTSHRLRRWFPKSYQSMRRQDEEGGRGEENGQGAGARSMPLFKIYRTPAYRRGDRGNNSPCTDIEQILVQLIEILRRRETWRGTFDCVCVINRRDAFFSCHFFFILVQCLFLVSRHSP